MEVEVYNINGKKTTRKVTLEDAVFGIEPNDHAIYLDVKQHLANKRQGTHCAKERSMLSGSTRKLRKQKGAGAARMGDIKSPIFKGGARVFGPKPRDYSFKLNKKLKRLARMSALAYKIKDNNLVILEDFSMEAPKTKAYLNILNSFEVGSKKTLLVVAEPDRNLLLSSRNLEYAKVVKASDLNTYDLLNANKVLMVESSVKEIENVLLK